MELIAQLQGDGSSSYYEFAGIPDTYKSLRAIVVGGLTSTGSMLWQLNSESSTNHTYYVSDFDGTSYSGRNGTNAYGAPTRTETSTTYRIDEIEINNYNFDTASSGEEDRPAYRRTAQIGTSSELETQWGIIYNDSNTGAITSLRLYVNTALTTASKVYLYGIG